jgi:hypothetical protein
LRSASRRRPPATAVRSRRHAARHGAASGSRADDTHRCPTPAARHAPSRLQIRCAPKAGRGRSRACSTTAAGLEASATAGFGFGLSRDEQRTLPRARTLASRETQRFARAQGDRCCVAKAPATRSPAVASRCMSSRGVSWRRWSSPDRRVDGPLNRSCRLGDGRRPAVADGVAGSGPPGRLGANGGPEPHVELRAVYGEAQIA